MSDYEVLAVRYGTRATTRSDTFFRYGVYGEPDGPMPVDYFFWVLRNDERTILVDSGFSDEVARSKGRLPLVEPVEALARLGIAADSVSEIIVSHFHWDHIGNLASFPDAHLTCQQRELAFWTGPYGTRAQFAAASVGEEVAYLAEAERAGRLTCLEGDAEIVPGVNARLCGGHCPGQQLIDVTSASGRIVLASDALHFYEEMERDMPFAVMHDLELGYRSLDMLRADEQEGATIIAGHDPRVMERFTPYDEDGLAVRIS